MVCPSPMQAFPSKVLTDPPTRAAETAYGPTLAQDSLQSLIVAQERELSRIARELHDDVCQRLAMLSLRIDKVANAWSTGQTKIGEQLEQIRQQCSALTGDVQALSHELHPSILDNLGLVAAVKSFCREITEQRNVLIELTSRNVPESLPREVALCLFRVVQEAIHNAVKHSRGDRYQVQLHGFSGGIRLEICDWGVGFDAAKIENNGRLGVISMRERIQLLHGTIQIESRLNSGTRIYASVPLDRPSRSAPIASKGRERNASYQDSLS